MRSESIHRDFLTMVPAAMVLDDFNETVSSLLQRIEKAYKHYQETKNSSSREVMEINFSQSIFQINKITELGIWLHEYLKQPAFTNIRSRRKQELFDELTHCQQLVELYRDLISVVIDTRVYKVPSATVFELMGVASLSECGSDMHSSSSSSIVKVGLRGVHPVTNLLANGVGFHFKRTNDPVKPINVPYEQLMLALEKLLVKALGQPEGSITLGTTPATMMQVPDSNSLLQVSRSIDGVLLRDVIYCLDIVSQFSDEFENLQQTDVLNALLDDEKTKITDDAILNKLGDIKNNHYHHKVSEMLLRELHSGEFFMQDVEVFLKILNSREMLADDELELLIYGLPAMRTVCKLFAGQEECFAFLSSDNWHCYFNRDDIGRHLLRALFAHAKDETSSNIMVIKDPHGEGFTLGLFDNEESFVPDLKRVPSGNVYCEVKSFLLASPFMNYRLTSQERDALGRFEPEKFFLSFITGADAIYHENHEFLKFCGLDKEQGEISMPLKLWQGYLTKMIAYALRLRLKADTSTEVDELTYNDILEFLNPAIAAVYQVLQQRPLLHKREYNLPTISEAITNRNRRRVSNYLQSVIVKQTNGVEALQNIIVRMLADRPCEVDALRDLLSRIACSDDMDNDTAMEESSSSHRSSESSSSSSSLRLSPERASRLSLLGRSTSLSKIDQRPKITLVRSKLGGSQDRQLTSSPSFFKKFKGTGIPERRNSAPTPGSK